MTSVLPLIARRIIVSVVILFIVSALLFCILRLLPVDPAAMSMPPNATLAEIEAKRREMGLDQPLFQQYLIWLAQVLHGDFGASIHFRRGVARLISGTLPATRAPLMTSCSRLRQRRAVDLPHPDGPMIEVTLPSVNVRLTLRIACCAPYQADSPSARRAGAPPSVTADGAG